MGCGFHFRLLLSVLLFIIIFSYITLNYSSSSSPLLGRGAGGEASYSLFTTSAGFLFAACHTRQPMQIRIKI